MGRLSNFKKQLTKNRFIIIYVNIIRTLTKKIMCTLLWFVLDENFSNVEIYSLMGLSLNIHFLMISSFCDG